ncbi:hypothetical protein CHCC20348_0940 [Bacillus paralicheniformis]|nr:hypothetical protein CHCC20348_0940 [Bacillus paralicheniformis]
MREVSKKKRDPLFFKSNALRVSYHTALLSFMIFTGDSTFF